MYSVARFLSLYAGGGGRLRRPRQGHGVPADGEQEAGDGGRHVRASARHHQCAQVTVSTLHSQ